MQQLVRMVRPVSRLLYGALLLGTAGCVSSSEFQSLGEEVKRLKALTVQQQGQIAQLQIEDRNLWRGLRCTDRDVADFMSEAEKCAQGQCPQRNLDRVLGFMIDQKHVLIRLRPNQPVAEMAALRVTQLKDMLEPQALNPLSRLLILTMQVNLLKDEAVRLPEEKAEQLVHYIRRDLQLAPTTGRVGPFPVNCEQKSLLLEQYSKRAAQDKPVPQEPKSREPQVAIWIFKVDCG